MSDRATEPRRRLARRVASPVSHRVAEALIHVLAMTAIAAILLIFGFVAKEALPLFFDPAAIAELGGLDALVAPRSWSAGSEPSFVWQPVGDTPKMNLVPLFVGTLKVTVIAMSISVPLGLLAAVFVAQYASPRAREIIKPAIELLASVPSVVLGFFALMILATGVQHLFGLTYRLNAFVAALGLSIAVVPMIFTVAEDALRAVPRDLQQAAFALGARKYQVVLRVVIPAALPGLAAAAVLGFGRAIGETMVVLMASGNAAVVEVFDPTSSARTVTATIASELGEVTRGELHWRVLFLLGALLFAITFLLNRIGASFVARLHRRLSAERGRT